MTVRHRQTRWAAALTVGSAVLILAAACAGSDSDGKDSPTTNDSGQTGPLAAYASCLKQQGVDLPDNLPSMRPRPNGSGRPSGWPSGRPSAWPSGRPSGAPSPGAFGRFGGGRGGLGGSPPPGVDAATWQKAQEACRSVLPTDRPGRGRGPNGGGPGANPAYANCLSDHGVQPGAGLDPSDPKVAAALQTCKVLSPAPTPAAS